jgi:hypothetical protein
MILSGTEQEDLMHTINTDNAYAEYSPGDEDDDDLDEDDDEDFDDLTDDGNNLHDVIVEENIDDADDDDHLPEEGF